MIVNSLWSSECKDQALASAVNDCDSDIDPCFSNHFWILTQMISSPHRKQPGVLLQNYFVVPCTCIDTIYYTYHKHVNPQCLYAYLPVHTCLLTHIHAGICIYIAGCMHYILHACRAAYVILQLLLVSLWPSHSFDANDGAVDQMLTNGWHYCHA